MYNSIWQCNQITVEISVLNGYVIIPTILRGISKTTK